MPTLLAVAQVIITAELRKVGIVAAA